MKIFIALIPMFAVLCGCSLTLTLPYQPTTTAELKGNIEVDNFKYFPRPGVKQNQVRNTAAGTIYLTENVEDFYCNALKREMRQATLSLKPGAKCKLSGEVNDFAMDDLGYSVTYISNVHYVLTDTSGKALYDNIFDIRFETSKFLVAQAVFANINKTISDNIGKLLTDQTFSDVVAASCQ